MRESYIKYKNKYPWIMSFGSARDRCRNKNNLKFPRYGGRGIKFLMTPDDFKYLWFRDKAFLMTKPTIDRINNDGNYELKNCRFLEHRINSGAKRVKQVFPEGKFKIFNSISDAQKYFGDKPASGNLTRCLKKITKKYRGFKWERVI